PSGPAGFDRTTAYVPLGSGRVVAVDLEQSTLRWSHDINTTLAPVVDDGLVVIAGDEQLAAFDAATGAGRWSVPVAGGFSAPPLLDSGWVVAAASGGDILTIRVDDGQVRLTKAIGSRVVERSVFAA